LSFVESPIEEEFSRAVAKVSAILPQGERLTELTRQNMQARIRGSRMWDFASSTGAMWLQTGNMTEKAVGYTAVGGDLMGAYSLIGNLPKTVVIELLDYLGEKY